MFENHCTNVKLDADNLVLEPQILGIKNEFVNQFYCVCKSIFEFATLVSIEQIKIEIHMELIEIGIPNLNKQMSSYHMMTS